MTRTHAFLAFLALAILRIALGYHFFKEGQAKLESGTFTAEYFLSAANGPLAPKFKAMLDDPDGMIALCATKDSTDGGRDLYKFCLLYTSPSPRDLSTSRMPSSA